MPAIIRNRTIRPSTRLSTSPYKVSTRGVSANDTLIVNVNHESNEYFQRFYFRGTDVEGKDIHFKVESNDNCITINWYDAAPSLIPEPTIMELKPEWFMMGYYVYVVVMKHKKEKYFYVGMTGDRKHFTARSPFYRMSGHFTKQKSTQNQIYKALETLGKELVIPTDTLIMQMNITYYAYMLNAFDPTNNSDHHPNRKFAEHVESALIDKIGKSKMGRVFNKKKSIKNSTQDQIATEILNDIKMRF